MAPHYSDSRVEDPQALGRAGDGARDIADATKAVGKYPVEETRQAASSFRGGNWDGDLGSTLLKLAEAWESQASSLSQKMHHNATALGQTGLSYDKAETRATENMRQGLRDIN